MIRIPTVLAAILIGTGAVAQGVPDRATAAAALFTAEGAQLQVLTQDFLSEADIATLRAMPEVAQLDYYGALAVPPDEGLRSSATRGAFNYHSPVAAQRAALAGCRDARPDGADCAIVALILPLGYEDGRALTLSRSATAAVVARDFAQAGADTVLAASASSGAWGIGDGAQTAIAACAADGATDCKIAVAD